MPTQVKIKKAKQKLARLERSYAMSQIKNRKEETRKKIQLGGLIVKANMEHYAKDIILGALLHAKSQLDLSPENKNIFKSLGAESFKTNDQEP